MSDVKALFGLIDKRNKRRLIGAVICCVLSVLCGILPYLGVWGKYDSRLIDFCGYCSYNKKCFIRKSC